MALALLLRNAGKFNALPLGAGFLKTSRLAPLKMYTTIVATQRSVVPKVKNVALLSRNISLTAPKLSAGGNHAPLWTIEKLVAVGIFALIPVAFLFPSQPLDAIMAVSVILHAHWGIAAIIQDYVRPIVVGPILPVVANVTLFLVSIVSLAGLFYLIYNDIGIANSIKKLWAVNRDPGEGCCDPIVDDRVQE